MTSNSTSECNSLTPSVGTTVQAPDLYYERMLEWVTFGFPYERQRVEITQMIERRGRRRPNHIYEIGNDNRIYEIRNNDRIPIKK